MELMYSVINQRSWSKNIPSSFMTENPREHGSLPLSIGSHGGASQPQNCCLMYLKLTRTDVTAHAYLGLPEVDVGVAERGEEDLDAHLHGLRRRHLHLLDLQRLRRLPCHRRCNQQRIQGKDVKMQSLSVSQMIPQEGKRNCPLNLCKPNSYKMGKIGYAFPEKK